MGSLISSIKESNSANQRELLFSEINVDAEMKFGDDFEKLWPVTTPGLTQFGEKLLAQCKDVKKPNPLDLKSLIKNSDEFPVKFPINSCRICTRPEDRCIENQAASAYPIVHERVLWLFLRFLEHKKQHGTTIEKEMYAEMGLLDLIQRILLKRCAAFVGASDYYLLLSGEEGVGGFEKIGTNTETPPLVLANCLSYDEMKLSAFLSISSYSDFLNDGNRTNAGQIESDISQIETSGIIIGLIGPRLHRRDVMEFQDLVITKTQNLSENGYGINKPMGESSEIDRKFDYRQMWNDFYDDNGILYEDAVNGGHRFYKCVNKEDYTDNLVMKKSYKISGHKFDTCMKKEEYIDNLIMKKRYTISFDTLLLESETRAASSGKKAYVHVVGIGLGAWLASLQQEEIFLETFSQRLRALLPQLNHISFVHFSWFHRTDCGGLRNLSLLQSDSHPDGGIQIFISNRNPAAKLEGPQFENTLLIVSFAWDSNGLPGNEFWTGSLSSSGDSAAACSTLITELHNGHINKMVSGNNLHVASPDFGVLHIAEYANRKLSAN